MKNKLVMAMSLLAALALPGLSMGMSAEELNVVIASEKTFTLIDIRANNQFENGHIIGAINIPARLCVHKQLPPLGQVIVYGDGLDVGETEAAVSALSNKAGLTVEVLDGGYPAWQNLGFITTSSAGMKQEKMPTISYQKLVDISADNNRLILMDLRLNSKGSSKSDSQPVDLASEFPGTPVQSSPFQQGMQAKGLARADIHRGTDAMYVLIDNGDGQAEKTARQLKAAGVSSFVILAGGEDIIARKGKPGKEKQ